MSEKNQHAGSLKPGSAKVSPKDVSVILVGHGDRGANPSRNEALAKHAQALTAEEQFHHVTHGVLKGTPSLETALLQALRTKPAALVIYPFFMAEGYFVKSVLPERIADVDIGCPILICPPLGLNPRLPILIAQAACDASQQANIVTETARLLVVGHGSKIGPASAQSTRYVADAVRLSKIAPFAEIDVAFLEEEPFLEAQLTHSQRPTLVSGFFNGDGLHAGEDVPNAIAATNASAIYAGPIGQHDEISDLIKTSILDQIEMRNAQV